ncbi:hypothetical protein [Candidatus Nitrospira nitrificans]|uniref:Uncharacterized protein n=1 Tax=Candidatus Nitrospira nitrificans TaxID=1742973 RepID=A0A0S4L7W8_9BACT|nr:hypothetical protein [Candidatus Nitrospira nitrificans]CUS32894.1 hypothetical protein COMA2_110146 [Candidatus Nitrospira nitrificans]
MPFQIRWLPVKPSLIRWPNGLELGYRPIGPLIDRLSLAFLRLIAKALRNFIPTSSMFGHTNLPAHVNDWTRGTFRQNGSADVFAEWNKQAVDLNPKPFRQFGLKAQHGLFGRRC